jgi:hypothetical protein
LQLDRHDGSTLLSDLAYENILPARANLLLCTTMSIRRVITRASLRAYIYGYA